MPRQNRVTPHGELIAVPDRGMFWGNRGPLLDREGRLVVTSQRTRDQRRNLDDARAKVREVVARALMSPRPRRPTRAGAKAVERRLARKRVVGSRKKQRAAVRGDED